MSRKKFAVILSGGGVYDGAEINEVVLTLLALETRGFEYQCFAPQIEQYHVVNHLTGEVVSEKRQVLTEAARIVRGNVKVLSECIPEHFDALVVPGGFGVAKNLSNFATEGDKLSIQPEVLRVLNDFRVLEKPAGFMCIAPVLLPVIYGKGVLLTIGNDRETISVIEKLGGIHQVAGFSEVVIDEVNKVVTTPAYMLATSIIEAKSGIDRLIDALAKMN